MKAIRVDDRPQHGWGEIQALEARFAPMVGRLEALAAADASGYRRRVVAAGMLGYGVLGTTLVLFLGIVAGTIVVLIAHPGAAVGGIKLLIPIGGVALSLMLALRIEWPEPDGIAVSEAEAPALYALIHDVRTATRGPRIHDVRITDAMNAAIAQRPSLLFLRSHNILFLGLPLLQAMTEGEIGAVIAHEMGHSAARHGRSAAYVYRIRTRWGQVADRLPRGIVAGAMRRFFAWYGPWFSAYSFVLARQQEYEADAMAASVSGARTMADALLRTEYQTRRWRDGWSMIWSQSTQRPDPPASPYRTLGAILPEEPDDAAMATLAWALGQGPGLDDTHPSLLQRLDALDMTARLPAADGVGAEGLLGAALVDVTDRFDAIWHDQADAIWAEDYQTRQDIIAERDALERRAAVEVLDVDAHHRLAQLIDVLDGAQPGAEAFAAVLTLYPDSHGSRFRYGDALLDTGDDAGIVALLAAADSVPELRIAAIERIVRHAHDTDQPDLVAEFAPALDAAIAQEEAARVESSAIDEATTLRPLDEGRRAELADLARDVAGVRWLRASIRDLSSSTQIVIVFRTKGKRTGTEVLDDLIDALMPAGDLFGIEHSRTRRWLTRRLEAMPNSRVIG